MQNLGRTRVPMVMWILLISVVCCFWVVPNLVLPALWVPVEARLVEVSRLESPDRLHSLIVYRDPGLNATTPIAFIVVLTERQSPDNAIEVFRGYDCKEIPKSKSLDVRWLSNGEVEINGGCRQVLRSAPRIGSVAVTVR